MARSAEPRAKANSPPHPEEPRVSATSRRIGHHNMLRDASLRDAPQDDESFFASYSSVAPDALITAAHFGISRLM
jgi:hypothetical protein